MSKSKPTSRAPNKAQAKPKTGVQQAIPGAGKGGVIPPVEHRWKAGQPSPNPHGRPRKLKDLQELIIETLAEEVGDMTRARLMVRTMLIKSPSDRKTLLEYAFGKVPDFVELSGSAAKPLIVKVIYDDDGRSDGQSAALAFSADKDNPAGETL